VTSDHANLVPADHAGVAVSFAGPKGGSALVTFLDRSGKVVSLGATGRASPQAPAFMVGYDGQAFVTGLSSHNRVVLSLPDGGRCLAQFDYAPQPGRQVAIPGVACQPA
jgi:outer membrane usher protein